MTRFVVPRVLAACLASALPAAAGENGAGGPVPREPGPAPAAVAAGDGRRTLSRLPVNLGRGLVGVFHRDNLVPLLAGGVATGAASFLDDDVRGEVTDQLDWGDSLETGGGPVYSSIFVAGMFTAGRVASGGRFRAMTYDMLDAAIVNYSYTAVLKVAVGRERPNGEDESSFPSGHTSNAFALAAVAERHYGWKVGLPAYTLAGLVGASRINEDKHWLSDVVAGATLGYIAGRTVVRVNSRGLEPAAGRAATWSLSPIVARHARGLQLSGSF